MVVLVGAMVSHLEFLGIFEQQNSLFIPEILLILDELLECF